ncbi:MAG TPA: DUF6580 family putative transport protein [Gammaproteobacteria bacterium]|jgi:hypothetical protein
MLKPRHEVLIAMILAAALSRLVPHPPNFAPIGALALFGGAQFANRRLAFLVPLTAMLLSDLCIGFYSHMEWVYGSFALITCMGLWLRSHRTAWGIAGASLVASTLFFLITNFGVWINGTGLVYTKSLAGLVACYVAAIPFFGNTLLGDGFYCLMLFGGFALLENRFAILREPIALDPGAA